MCIHARSPDLNSLDYFLWGHLKNFIYRNSVETLEDLEEQLHCAIATVTPEMIQRVQENLIRRANMCI